jgi:hypothetical protein
LDVKTVITGVLLMYLTIWGTVSLFLYAFFPAISFSPVQAFSVFVSMLFLITIKELFSFRREDLEEMTIDEETRIILLATLKTVGGEVRIKDYTMNQMERDIYDYNIVHSMDGDTHIYKIVRDEQ